MTGKNKNWYHAAARMLTMKYSSHLLKQLEQELW